MTNEEQKLRGFATKQFPLSKELKKEVLYNLIQQAKQDECLSDLTALISEGYVSKGKHDKVLQQRDELREALKNLMDGVRGLPPLTAIVGVLEQQYIQAEAAIKNTDG